MSRIRRLKKGPEVGIIGDGRRRQDDDKQLDTDDDMPLATLVAVRRKRDANVEEKTPVTMLCGLKGVQKRTRNGGFQEGAPNLYSFCH
jgi:hypothetical protein